MQKFTIKNVETASGINTRTLRIWEQRYRIITPNRRDSKYRFYDSNDLKTFLQVSFLVYAGWKVVKLTDINTDELVNLVRNTQTEAHNYPAFIVRLLEATVDFDDQKFNRVLEEVIANAGLKDCIIKVAYPFLEKVKLLWVNSKTASAQELFSTCIIQNKIIAETDRLAVSSINKGAIVLFTPDKEYFNLHLLFINYLLKRDGWRTIFFGSNVNWRFIQSAIENKAVDAVYIHLVTNLSRFEVDDYLETLCKTFPDKQIVASGYAVHAAQRNFLNLRLLQSDAAIHSFINDAFLSATHK